MRFAYELLNTEGKLERGTLDAPNEGEARRQLQRLGGTVLGIDAGASGSGRAGRTSNEEILLVFTELTTLLHSGLGVAEAVGSIASAHERDSLRQMLEALGRGIAQGKSFAESLRQCGLRLPAYFYQLALAGEMTGKLAHSLDDALGQFAWQQEMRSEIRNALIYPAVLVVSGLLAVGVMFAFVVPRFAGMLKDAEELPWLAWAVLSVGDFLNHHLLATLVMLAALVAAVVYALRQPGNRAALYDQIATWPILGPWLSESETTSWAALLGALLGQGVPMLDSLALANGGVRLASRRRRLEAAARSVKAGLSLSKALEEQGALNATAYNLLRTGERAGRLPDMLKALAALYGKSSRNRMKRVLLLVEPVAILLIGSAIGTIVIGIVLAITSVSDIPL